MLRRFLSVPDEEGEPGSVARKQGRKGTLKKTRGAQASTKVWGLPHEAPCIGRGIHLKKIQCGRLLSYRRHTSHLYEGQRTMPVTAHVLSNQNLTRRFFVVRPFGRGVTCSSLY